MSNQDKRHRDTSLDAVGGMMILYMIFGHIWTKCGMNDNHFRIALSLFLNCFMPWFFFKAGMFFRPMKTRDLLDKDFRRLVIPFCVFTFIGIIVGLIYISQTDWREYLYVSMIELLKHGSAPGNAPLWFLLSLAISRFVLNIILKIGSNLRLMGIIALILLMIYLLFSYSQFTLPWYVVNSLAGTLFLLAGFYMKEKQYRNEYLLLSVVIFLFFITKYECRVGMFDNHLSDGDYFGWYLSSISAIIVFNNLFRTVGKIRWMKVLNHVGKNSMSYYCTHWILIIITINTLSYITESIAPIIKLVVCCVLCILILPVLNMVLHLGKLSYLIGESPRTR